MRKTDAVGGSSSSVPRRGRWSQAEQARLKELYGLKSDPQIARELNRPVASVRRMAERLFPRATHSGPWAAVEVQHLKQYLGATSEEVIAQILGRTVVEIRTQIIELGRIRHDGSWDREETAEFKRIYGTRTDGDLSRIFGRDIKEIQAHAKEHALAKDKAFMRKLNGESATRMPRWNADEIELLKREYPVRPNLDIARDLNRTVKSVVSKAHNIGLKKNPDRLRQMGRENVSQRYR